MENRHKKNALVKNIETLKILLFFIKKGVEALHEIQPL